MSESADLSLPRLRAMQRFASGLLLLVGAVYLIARMYEQHHWAIGYLRAFCEAALVGGLADWFAVSALFRHPLGIPLPHTAIIPTNKDRIGESLGQFVERNFLSYEVVTAKLAEIDFARHAAGWLADPLRSGPVAGQIARFLPRILDASADETIRRFVHHNLVEALRRIDVAPLAADLLETLTAQNRHQRLVDEIIAQARRFLDESELEIRMRVRDKTAWLWQKLGVDEAISDRLIRAAEEALAEISADPEHSWRQRFTDLVHDYVDELRCSPAYHARAERLKNDLLDHPLLAQYIGGVWDEARRRIRQDVSRTDSRIRAHLQAGLVHLGEGLMSEAAVRDALNAWLRHALTDLVEARRHEVAKLIAETVRRWDARTVSDRIERAIGRDLQYIRVNGTLIGGLVGVLIHALSVFLP
jgi:uncharacterized membrane-anchored protein YjiN (DUF445 family)